MANSIKLNEKKKYFFIYKTTNLLNGNYYIGMHSTNNLKDGYLGSGTRLRRSIRKYGKHNFKCEILEYCLDFNSLKEREKEIITEETIKDPLCMNLKPGGLGGFSISDAKMGRMKTNTILREKYGANFISIINKQYHESLTDVEKMLRSEKIKYRLKEIGFDHGNTFRDKQHSSDTKQIMSQLAKLRVGELNSQYGTMWITNGIENRKIKKEDNIPDKWYRGRMNSKNSLRNLKNVR